MRPHEHMTGMNGRARDRSPFIWTLLWLGPWGVAWGGLILLAQQTNLAAIVWTHRVFGWLLLLTYLAFWGWAIGLSRQPRLVFFRSVMWTLTLGGMLVCLEIPAIFRLVHWRILFQQQAGEGHRYTWAFEPDQELEFRRPANTRWVEQSPSDIELGWNMPPAERDRVVYTYDRWGYRNPHDLTQADVALIGDSYVEGWHVTDAETVAQRLQAQFGRPVVNLGIAGYGTQQEWRVFQHASTWLRPPVVVWFFFEGNDFYDDKRFEDFLAAVPEPHTTPTRHPHGFARHDSWLRRSFTLTLLRWLRRWSDPLLPNHSPYFGQLARPGHTERTVYFAPYAAVPWSAWLEERWAKVRATFEQAVALSQAQDIQLLVVFVPIKFRVYRPFMRFAPTSPCSTWEAWPLVERFMMWCRATGVPCLDLTGVFQAAVRAGGMPYAARDTHWSPEGHALVATHLTSMLRQRGWLADHALRRGR